MPYSSSNQPKQSLSAHTCLERQQAKAKGCQWEKDHTLAFAQGRICGGIQYVQDNRGDGTNYDSIYRMVTKGEVIDVKGKLEISK